MAWPNNENPFGENRTPAMFGLSYEDGVTRVPIAVDPATGAVLTEGGSTASSVNATVFQGSSPWVVNGTVSIGAGGSGVTTVYQGGAPWLVNASVQGNIPVTQATNPWLVQATIGVPNVLASIPNIINGIVTIANPSAAGGVTTVFQGGAPWLVNASIIGQVPVSATVATLVIGQMPPIAVTATNTTVFQGGAPWSVVGSVGATQQGTWTVGATLLGVSNVVGTISNLGVYNPVIPSLVSLAGGVTNTLELDQRSNLLINVATVSSPLPVNASIQGTVPVSGTFFQTNQPVTASIAGTPNVVIASTVTVAQGTNPWLVSASVGTPTVNQGTTPWIVDATVYGELSVTASVIGVPSVFVASGATISIGAMPGITVNPPAVQTVAQGAAPWVVTGSVLATQGGSPWTVNASLLGVSNVIATVVSMPTTNVIATIANTPTVNQGTSPWIVDATVYGQLSVTASLIGVPQVFVASGATISIGAMPGVTVNPPAVQTVAQGAAPWIVVGSVGATQLGAPWTVNASIQGTSSINIAQVNGTPVTTATLGTMKVALTDSNANSVSAFPAQFIRTTDEPHQIFYDPFDSTLDTTNRWNSPIAAGGGVIATVQGGAMTLGSGTTASGYSYIQSQPAITPTIPGWLGDSHAIQIPDGAAPTANTYLFIGMGVAMTTASISPTLPVYNGYGFERTTAGKLFAVVYANGVRTAVQDLSASGNNTQPLDANYHRYIVYYRTDKTYWYIDGLSSANLVATSNFQTSTVQTLPILYESLAASSAPAASATLTSNGLAVWDTAKNNNTLSDGTYGWRKATVKPALTIATTSVDTALVVTSRDPVQVNQNTSPWLVQATIGVPNVNATLVGVSNVIATVLQGTSPWLVNASVIGSLNVIPTVVTVLQGTSPWLVSASVGTPTVNQGTNPWIVNASILGVVNVVASQLGNLPQWLASVTNSPFFDGSVEMSMYPPGGAMISIVSAATYAYFPDVTDVNAQNLTTNGASASSVGALSYLNTSLVATCVTIKVGSANLYGYHFYNSGTTTTYVSIFAQTLATLGLTNPTSMISVPAGGWTDGSNMPVPIGYSPGLLVGASASINGSGVPNKPLLANIWYK